MKKTAAVIAAAVAVLAGCSSQPSATSHDATPAMTTPPVRRRPVRMPRPMTMPT